MSLHLEQCLHGVCWSWMARGCPDSEQLVGLFSSVCVWCWGTPPFTLVSQAPCGARFLRVGQQLGRLSWFHLSSCDNGRSFPSLCALQDGELPVCVTKRLEECFKRLLQLSRVCEHVLQHDVDTTALLSAGGVLQLTFSLICFKLFFWSCADNIIMLIVWWCMSVHSLDTVVFGGLVLQPWLITLNQI